MLKIFKRLFAGKPKFKVELKHVVTEAFECGGVKYYQMDSMFNLPYKRGLAAIEVYKELETRVDSEYMKKHLEACDKLFAKTPFGTREIAGLMQLNDQIKERMTWAVDTDLAYKLASVVFFDESEDPYGYNPQYCFDKIARWKKHESVNAFFLRLPLMKLIPSLGTLPMNADSYTAVQEQVKKTHSANIESIISGKGRGKPSH